MLVFDPTDGVLSLRRFTINATHDLPDVLRRLDACMLEYSHGKIGRDVFTLEYKVDAPIDTVLDPESMGKYLKLFSHRRRWVESRIHRFRWRTRCVFLSVFIGDGMC
jgi:hypothetical protein